MSERAEQLHATADQQIAGLIALVSTLDETKMRLACPGREKLGDGTIATAAQHTADNYQRIADFVQTSDQMTGAEEPNGRAGHSVPRFLKALGHRPPDHAEHGHDATGTGAGENEYTAENVDLSQPYASNSP